MQNEIFDILLYRCQTGQFFPYTFHSKMRYCHPLQQILQAAPGKFAYFAIIYDLLPPESCLSATTMTD